MSDPFVGEIRPFGFNFAPTGWAQCNGQVVPISQNTALFSLLGTNYGGNGTSTFGLPNLQGSVPIHMGQGVGLSSYSVGESSGTPTVTLTQGQMPSHTHPAEIPRAVNADTTSPTGALWATAQGNDTPYIAGTPSATMLSPATATQASGNAAHNNLMPYLVVNFCIALQGIFPPRS